MNFFFFMARTQKSLTDVEIDFSFFYFFLYLKTLKSWLLSDVNVSVSFELLCLGTGKLFFFLTWNAVLANHNSIFDLAFVIWAATGTLQSVANVLDQVLVTLHS